MKKRVLVNAGISGACGSVVLDAFDRLIKEKGFEFVEELRDEEANVSFSKVWDRKYINNLPDIAFALILSGGKKDSEGKTKPRSLRKLPHHTKAVKSPTENSTVDVPHLRNALSRAPQMKGVTSPQRKRAIGHLRRHASKLLKNEKGFVLSFTEKIVIDSILKEQEEKAEKILRKTKKGKKNG